MTLDLPLVWALLLAFAVLAYVVLDGFDLGVGILYPTLKPGEERDTAMNTVAPVWDGNETWLILGGGGLFAVFPLAYAIIMPALYMPVMLMLLGLIFRGVSFEYRWRDLSHQWFWDGSFAAGSFVASLTQGIILGAIIQGIEVENRQYAGGWWDWLTPFTVTTGVALTIAYALLGATWLVLKTEDPIKAHAEKLARTTGAATLVMIAVVSLWTVFLDPVFMERWFAYPAILYVVPVPILTALAAWSLFTGLAQRRDARPFLSALALFVLSFIGLGISLYPYIAPPTITIRNAAAPDTSLLFMLVGAVILLPIILAYTAYSYWVFRGKIRHDEGYH